MVKLAAKSVSFCYGSMIVVRSLLGESTVILALRFCNRARQHIEIVLSKFEMKIMVTGGAGFIGSAVVRHLIENTAHDVMSIDKLTYAGNPDSVASVASSPRYSFRLMARQTLSRQTLLVLTRFWRRLAVTGMV